MWYKDFFKIYGIDTREILVNKLKVSPSSVSYWKNGKKLPSLKHCIQIQKLTKGKIKVEDIRPEFREL